MKRILALATTSVAVVFGVSFLVGYSGPAQTQTLKSTAPQASSTASTTNADRGRDEHGGRDAVWSQPSVVATFQPGQPTTTVVTLTARDELDPAAVRITPSLLPYLSVSPTTTGRLKRGQAQQFTLTFAAPISALPTTTQGVIQLREVEDRKHKGELVANPLPVAAQVVWQSASNLPGGLTFSYPTFGLTSSISWETSDFGSAGIASIFDVSLATPSGTPVTSKYLVTAMLAQGSSSISNWFSRFIDHQNQILSSNAFVLTQVNSDIEALVLSNALPAGYEGGPVSEVYALIRSQNRVIAITTSDAATIKTIGVSREMLLRSYLNILTTIKVQ